jgi:hypothetical protein
MQFVYLCRNGENEELRYSIRSVLKWFPDAEIVLVGGRPSWYRGKFVRVNQSGTKFENVHNNLKALCSSTEIDEEIVMMNDDFFIVSQIDEIPYIYGGKLKDKIINQAKLTGNSAYLRMLKEMYREIKRNGIQEPLDYTLHVPMRVQKSKLKFIIDRSVAWRSRYGNYYKVGGEMWEEDVKVFFKPRLVSHGYDFTNMRHPFISTSDQSFDLYLKPILKEMFPDPSVYEKPTSMFKV